MRLLLLILLSFSLSAPALAAPSLCVLVFDRLDSRITEGVLDVYGNYPDAIVVTEANPSDLLRCVQGGSAEMVIIAHAIETKAPAQILLGYFPRLPTPAGSAPSYRLAFFLDHAFQVVDEELQKQRAGGESSLRKIRFMACDPKDIFHAYPSLQAMITDNGITLDVAPTSPFLSAFEDVPVTSFSTAWLAKDIDCSSMTAWRTDRNPSCRFDSWPGCNRQRAQYCLPPAL